MVTFELETIDRPFFERRMDPFAGDIAQPRNHFSVGEGDVDRISVLRLQWVKERFAQVPMESLHFAFGLSAVRRAQLYFEAAMFGEVEQLAVELVLAFVVGIAFDDERLRVIAQHMQRHSAEPMQCAF